MNVRSAEWISWNGFLGTEHSEWNARNGMPNAGTVSMEDATECQLFSIMYPLSEYAHCYYLALVV
jgi:hypothetical protein